MLDNISKLKESIERSLRAGSIRKYKFSVGFRFDVFRYVFGSDREHFSEEDFPAHLFPAGWSVVYDRLGDGCSIDFPIVMKPSLIWSPPCYSKLPDGHIELKPRYFTEVVCVTLNKSHC